MAIYRSVYTKFWNEDSKVVDNFTPEDRYFYLYLLTNPHTNICGCYELPIKQAELETGYNKETIERLLERMESIHNVILRDGSEVLIINWYKYNWSHSEKLIRAVRDVAQYISSPKLKEIINRQIELYIND